jgi:hypothetical protein
MDRGVHMHYIKRSVHGCAALVGLVSCLVLAPPALADTRSLHLSVPVAQFTSFTCLNDSCTLTLATVVGTATSNLDTGLGSFQATLITDFSPGGNCNIADESDAFVFDKGTIFVHSHHEDCATNGLRIDTTFQVTGGSGTFQGATGSGREFGAATPSANSKVPIIYNGTISC